MNLNLLRKYKTKEKSSEKSILSRTPPFSKTPPEGTVTIQSVESSDEDDSIEKAITSDLNDRISTDRNKQSHNQ